MSLQVWLPLNGNLNNQGLDGSLGFTNTASATVTTDGKIGSCYSFSSTSGSGLLLSKGKSASEFMDAYINHHSWSMCAWVRTTSNDNVVFGLTYGLRLWCGSTNYVHLYNNTRNVSASNNISTIDGKWHHICATYNTLDNAVDIYVDGIKGTTSYYPSGETYASSWTNAVAIGRDFNNSTASSHYYFQGSMNDVRIYDHCLSAKEVKEISRGLVCHYKLNNKGFENPNLIEDSSFSANTTSSYVYRDSSRLFNGKPTLKITRSGATSLTYTGWSRTVTNVKAGDTIYASAWVYIEDPSSIDAGCEWRVYQTHNDGTANNWSGWYSSSLFKKDTWVRVGRSYTLDTNLSSAVFNMNVVQNGTYWIAEPKVEYGTKPTTWCPHTSDSLYTLLGLNSLIESDCSGYSYNGTLSESLPYASDSPRYDGCYYFGSTSKRITLPVITMSGFSNSFSISWWGKAPSYSSLMYWGFSDGNRLNYYDGMYCNTGDGSSNPYYKPNTTTTISTPSVDTWHHFVMVGDGSSNKLYMDGELYGVAKSYKGITGSTIVINGWDSSTSYKTNGYISDFRIYSTALSASDIKELYNTSASVDKNGNMYAYEFKEE